MKERERESFDHQPSCVLETATIWVSTTWSLILRSCACIWSWGWNLLGYLGIISDTGQAVMFLRELGLLTLDPRGRNLCSMGLLPLEVNLTRLS